MQQNATSNNDPLTGEAALRVITSLIGMYSREGRKEEQNGYKSLLIDYSKMQSKFKKMAVFLVSANNKERLFAPSSRQRLVILLWMLIGLLLY